MIHVGITGGIGSGKTTVCKLFECLGIPIYYADDRAKALMVENPSLIAKLKDNFGEEVYLEDGQLNRPYLSKLVFGNKEKLEILNNIVHPAVFQDGLEWMQACKDVPYTLKEAALLFESGSYKMMHKVITVVSPIELRIERLLKRDNSSEEAIKARMDKQLSDEEKTSRSDFIIRNDQQHPLIPQVYALHQKLCKLSEETKSEV